MTPATDHSLKDISDILKGALAAAGGFVVRSGARILFLFMAGNLYGADRFGTLAYAVAVVETLAAIAVFGQKRALFALLDEDGADRNAIILNALVLTAVISLTLSLLLYAIFWPLIDMPAGGPYRAFAFVIPLIALSDVMLATTRHQRLMRYEVIARSIAEPWTLAALTLGFYMGGFLEGGLMAAYFGALVVAYLASAWGFGRVYRLADIATSGLSWAKVKRIISFSGPTAAVDVMALVFRRVDIFFLWHFTSETVVGIYHAAQHIATLVQKTRFVFEPILAPVLSQTLSRSGAGAAGRQLAQVCRWIFAILALPTLLLILFAAPVLGLVGEGMEAGAIILGVMLVAEAIEAALGSSELPILFRAPGRNMGLMLVAFAAHIAGCTLLIPLYGGLGAALSLLIGLSLLNVLRLGAVARLFGIYVLDRQFLKPIAAVALALGGGLFAESLAGDLDLIWAVGIQIAAMLLIYLAALKLLGISEEGRALIALLRRGQSKNTTANPHP